MRNFIYIFCLLIINSISVSANDRNPVLLLRERLNSITTLQANFKQHTASLTEKKLATQLQSGKFYSSKPNLFRLEIIDPDKQLIVSDGKNLWTYDLELEQITVKPLVNNIIELPVMLITGDIEDIEKSFKVQVIKNSDSQVFSLTPKDKDSLITEIKIKFVADLINQIIINDSINNKTIVNLTNVKTNQKLADNLFNFIPPKGVDVVGKINKD